MKVTLADDDVLTGRIGTSTDSAVALDVDGSTREVAYDDIVKALVQIEFNRKDTSTDQKTEED